MRVLRTIRPLFLLVVAIGCYRFTPIDGVAPSEGTDVRLHLNDAGSVSLAPFLGFRVELVDGALIAVEDTAYVLAVTSTTNRIGNETSWSRERVGIPRTAVARLERKRLDRGRSWIAAGVTTAAAVASYLVFDLVRSTSGGGGDRGGGGGPK